LSISRLLDPLQGATRQLRTRVYLALAGVLLAVTVLSAGMLWFQHGQILDKEQRRAENLATILADHFARSVEGIESTLRTLALYGRQIGRPRAADPIWQSLIETGLAGLPGARALLVIDEGGTITHSTIPGATGQDRRAFPLFRQISASQQDGIVADPMYRSLVDGVILVTFAHRLVGPDGAFAGIVVAALEPSRLQNFYRSVEAGPNGMIFVLHPQGEPLFSEPSNADTRTASTAAIIAAQRQNPDGSVLAPLLGGRDAYIVGYRTLVLPTLVVAVSFAQSDVLAGWRNQVMAQTATLALIALALLMAGLFIGREVQARSVAEQRFQAILDHAPLALSVKNSEGLFTFVNRAFTQSFNIDATAVLGKRSHDIMPKLRATLAGGMDREVLTGRRVVQSEITVEDPVNPGTERRLFMVKFPLFDAHGQVEAVGTVAADVTEQQALKEQLVHTRKMEALGQLTGGIAHDFNNLLTTILLNSGILCSHLCDEQALSLARDISYAAERGSQLTKRLLSFGRRQWLDPQPTDIGVLVESMGDMLQRVLGSHIEVGISTAEGGPHAAMIDPGQLENALLNLAVNARDAMPEAGRLLISTRLHVDAAAADGGPHANYIALSVTDTGCGMRPEVLARACDPFFTTKGVGKGTGLGLSMVYGFLKQSGGRVEITSEVGTGTTVTLLLPQVEEDSVDRIGGPTGPAGPGDAGEASAARPPRAATG
jgi:PAS domain S-box-containing protein